MQRHGDIYSGIAVIYELIHDISIFTDISKSRINVILAFQNLAFVILAQSNIHRFVTKIL